MYSGAKKFVNDLVGGGGGSGDAGRRDEEMMDVDTETASAGDNVETEEVSEALWASVVEERPPEFISVR